MQIQAGRSPLQNIAQLVLAANPAFATALSNNNIFFDGSVSASAPTVLTGDPSGHNTSVTLTALPSSALTGACTVKYTRLSLADGANQVTPAANVPMTQADDAQSMQLFIANALGLISTEFVLSGAITRPADTSNNPQTVATLTANNNGLTYLDGTTIDVTLTWVGKLDIPSNVTNTTMSGFDVTSKTAQPA